MRSKRIPHWIAALTATTLLIAACASQESAPDPAKREQQIAAARVAELDLVRATVEEPERAERVVALLAERDELVEHFAEQLAAHEEQMHRLNADYQSQRSAFEAALADYNRQRSTAQSALIQLISDMKQATTAEEWDEIADFQQKRLRPRDLAFRGLSGGWQ